MKKKERLKKELPPNTSKVSQIDMNNKERTTMFVTEDLKSAVAEAQEFEKNEIYTESMCLKPTKGGVGVKTLRKQSRQC